MERILSFSQEHGLLERDELTLCAVSGGPDSVALLHFLKAQGFLVAAAHFDHHLRPTSGRDRAFVEELCRTWDIPCYVGEGLIADLPGNTEDNARRERYAFLEATAAAIGAARIATAHNANDNLETVLLHMTRGCGLQGLCGIQPRRGLLVRPMLHTTRPAIETYLKEHHLPYVTDETNADDRYARNRLRHQVVPVLESLNPRVVEAVARMTDRLRADLERLGPWSPETRPEALPPLEPRTVAVGERLETPLWVLETAWAVCPDAPPTPNDFYLSPLEPLTLRARRTGDFLRPPFRRGKSVKKWMIEEKVPRVEREATPVLTAGEELAAVAGLGPQAHLLAQPGRRAIHVTWFKT